MFYDDGDSGGERQRFTRRALLLGAAQAAAFGAIGWRLYQLQVIDERRYAPLADHNRINIQAVAPQRGRILDRFGEVLAANREGYRAVLRPSNATSVREVLDRLAQIIPIGLDTRDRVAARARRSAPSHPLIVASDLTFEQVAEINVHLPSLPGIETELAPRRVYFHGLTVGHVVGHVGVVERVAIDDEPVMRIPGLRVGKTGIEGGLEERLRGVAGTVKREVDVRGRIVRDLESTEPQRGADVVTTIDTGLQEKLMARLARETRAAAVALHIESGEVVAMGSFPGHDPNEIAGGIAPRAWDRLQQAQHDPLLNRAIRGAYPPGSTFKLVTALAALEAGAIDLKSRITCSGRYEYADQTFRCWKRSGHGQVDFHRGLRESCDCYYYELARRVGIDAIALMARRLGLGETYDCGLAQQKPGIVPTPDWKRGRFGKGWLGGETLLAAIGQGYVLATPLQLAVMTARVASGRHVEPTLVREDGGRTGAPFPGLGIAQGALEAVRKGLAAVVNEAGGTGHRAQLEDDNAPLVAGKTGTSQVSRLSADRPASELKWEERDHALFVGYVPADRPRYAVAVVVEHGGGGGSTAAPLARDLIQEVLARDPMARPAYSLGTVRDARPLRGSG